MIAFLRGAWILLSHRRRGRLALDGVSHVNLRVWPGDLDTNMHMNNGRYFSLADLGRFDWGLRSDLWPRALRRGWRPVAGDSNARYSRSLQPFERYCIESRLLGWNDKWFYSEHRFMRQGHICATVMVRYLFTSKQGKVPTAKVLELAGFDPQSPPLPAHVQLWSDAQEMLSAELKRNAGR